MKKILSLFLLLVATLVHATGEPSLDLQRQGTNVVVEWSTNSPCYVFETTTNLTGGAWVSHPYAPSVINDHYRVTLAADAPARYLRLHRSPSSPPTPHILVNGQLGQPGDGSDAQWVMYGCTITWGCSISALAADTVNVFDASYSIDWARCTTNDPPMTFQWIVRYPQDSNNGVTYTSSTIQGRDTPVLTLPVNALPNVQGSGQWRIDLLMTSQVDPSLSNRVWFNFRYIGSEF